MSKIRVRKRLPSALLPAVTFRIQPANQELGVLRFNSAALQQLENHGMPLLPHTNVQLHLDPATLVITVTYDENGDFHFYPWSRYSVALSSVNLTVAINRNVDYSIECNPALKQITLTPVKVFHVKPTVPMKSVPKSVAKLAWKLKLQKTPTLEIIRKLNKTGYKTPKQHSWNRTSLRLLLKRCAIEFGENSNA